MEWFISETVKWNQFEILIDTSIFGKEVILKAAYNFLDKWYFFFKMWKGRSIILQFTRKEWINIPPEKIIWEYTDELLSVYLRDKLEINNKSIRESIVGAAIWSALDPDNYRSIDTSKSDWQLDFDKDIDDILKEIENDPELKIDEEEIERILKEIEEETKEEEKKEKKNKKKLLTKNTKNAKKKLQNWK